MNKTKIEWCDYTWNPIKGLCPVGCWYCYARKIYQRFKLNPEIRLDLDELMHHFPKKPSRIFVCSTFELFHPLAKPYRNNIFKHIEVSPEHTFIILTKRPQYIDRPMPDNVWLGVSVSRREDRWRIDALHNATARIKFISFEPLFEDDIVVPNGILSGIDWIIVGRLTGYGRKYDPPETAIQDILRGSKIWNIPVFIKNNLKEIWGEPLIQEYPK